MDTITRSTLCDCRTALIAYAINGLPASKRTFFRGIALDPPRAGIIARILKFLVIYLNFLVFDFHNLINIIKMISLYSSDILFERNITSVH